MKVETKTGALPGFGGGVAAWADYKFAVDAIKIKESALAESEKKNLGPLALRLVERLQGQALQGAKRIGADALARADGVDKLMSSVEEQLLMKKQAAMELYDAGMREEMLSIQNGESMTSYTLRRGWSRKSWTVESSAVQNRPYCMQDSATWSSCHKNSLWERIVRPSKESVRHHP